MKRIYLTKFEIAILNSLYTNGFTPPTDRITHRQCSDAIRSLECKGLAEARYEEGGYVADARLTPAGRTYMASNPSLRRPINWRDVAMWIGIGLAAVSAAASLFACARAGVL